MVLGNKEFITRKTTAEKGRITGRIVSVRKHKRVTFVDVNDGFREKQVAIDNLAPIGERVVRGDFFEFSGEEGSTRTGQETLFASKGELVLRPPEYRGEDREMKETIINRAKLTRELRGFFESIGIVEVQSPIIGNSPGSSKIEPWVTVDSKGKDRYLRYTMELELKKIMYRTQLPVYEFGLLFRNFGNSLRRREEYSAIEAYIPYMNIDEALETTNRLLKRLFVAFGKEAVGINVRETRPLFKELTGSDDVLDERQIGEYDARVKQIEGPLIIRNKPSSWCSPFAEYNPDGTGQDFELVCGGIGTIIQATEECADYDVVEKRLQRQLLEVKQNRKDAELDEEFLRELRSGGPPAVGVYIGFERLLMFLTGKTHMRDVVVNF